MTPERLENRYRKLLDICQDEALCEDKVAAAVTDIEKQIPLINLVGAREARNALLRKWGLYPTVT